MAKRFTDTNKWRKPFIKGLSLEYKLLWFYILDDCDHAGIWQVDLEIASLRIGYDFNIKDCLSTFGSKVIEFHNREKWFIKDFIDFQYGELNPKNRAHNSVISLLKKYKLLEKNKELLSPLQGAKDKDKDKDKDKVIDNDKKYNIGDSEFFKKIFDEKFKMQINSTLMKEFPKFVNDEFRFSQNRIDRFQTRWKKSLPTKWTFYTVNQAREQYLKFIVSNFLKSEISL